MSDQILLSASEEMSLGATTQKAMEILQDGEVAVVTAAEISGAEASQVARILLRNPADKPRAIELLTGAKIDAR